MSKNRMNKMVKQIESKYKKNKNEFDCVGLNLILKRKKRTNMQNLSDEIEKEVIEFINSKFGNKVDIFRNDSRLINSDSILDKELQQRKQKELALKISECNKYFSNHDRGGYYLLKI